MHPGIGAPRPIRVAVVGGGCAALTAAFELTRPELHGKYAVTIYQMGWRLGGKGASGRGPAQRIEEHGLHLWMGYYENAFRMVRDCYAELGRDPSRCRIARWSDGFLPAQRNAAMDRSPDGVWRPWNVLFPPAGGLPGDPDPPRCTIVDYLARSASLVVTLLKTLQSHALDEAVPSKSFPDLGEAPLSVDALRAALVRMLELGSVAGLGVAIEAARLLETILGKLAIYPQSLVAQLLEVITAGLRRQLDRLVEASDEARRLWEVCDLLMAVIRGSLRFRLAFDPRGFDALDEYDCREWLRMNGASRAALDGAFLRAMYDLAFAYENGDSERPRIAAGSALRGAMRAFFTHRGAFFWKLRAGMGDVVFAPLYEVLTRRGVRFEFFHKLTNVGLGPVTEDDSAHVASLEFDVQARSLGGAYQPLIDVDGVPCWPARPLYDQLDDGARMERERWDVESQWDTRRAGVKRLDVGLDFDLLVLGVGLGVIPYVCREILARDERWADMVRRVKAVPTQAFQLWLNRSMADLGWPHGVSNVSGFVEPFDTWADMTHLVPEESWQRHPPRAIAYFCNVLPSVLPSVPRAAEHRATRASLAASGELDSAAADALTRASQALVRDNALTFLERDVKHLWPLALDGSGRFCWDALVAPDDAGEPACDTSCGRERFDSQFWTANVRPSDLYSQALPGSTMYRISPLDRSYDNMTVTGDWTECSLNMGCVEAAVISGMLAAHAIAQSPVLTDIVGYDHP